MPKETAAILLSYIFIDIYIEEDWFDVIISKFQVDFLRQNSILNFNNHGTLMLIKD